MTQQRRHDINLGIRKACLADVPALHRLYAGEKGVTDFDGMHTLERFRRLVRSKTDIIIVAEYDGKIAGALDAEIYRESAFSYFANIVVAKGMRGKGVGRCLIERYETICRQKKLKAIIALVYDWNRKMHGVMRKARYRNKGMLVEYLKRL
jgi:N-acetylglutamate synthase-like GNAT family acetyltransferase